MILKQVQDDKGINSYHRGQFSLSETEMSLGQDNAR